MGGFIFYVFPIQAKAYLSPLYVNVCYNFVPFFGQILAFFLELQEPPGIWTTYGGPCVFIGCILLFMDHKDQLAMSKVPLVGSHIELQ